MIDEVTNISLFCSNSSDEGDESFKTLATSILEIFGAEPPAKKEKKRKRDRMSSGQSSRNSSPIKREIDESPPKEPALPPQPKRIKITKDSPPKKVEVKQEMTRKEKQEVVVISVEKVKKEKAEVVGVEKTKKSPKKDSKESTALRKRHREPEVAVKKELPSRFKPVVIKEEPEVSARVEPEPKKERKKRKQKVSEEQVPML